MPRQPKPFRRVDTKAWYGRVLKRKVWLAPPEATKTEAQEILTRELAAARREARRPEGATFEDVVDYFLDFGAGAVKRNDLKPITLEGYERFLLPAALAFGRHPVSGLKPKHVQAWLDSKTTWNSTTRNNAVTAVKACLNWARKQGHIEENPLRDMDKPTPNVTEADMTAAQAHTIMAAVKDRAFKDFLAVMWGTGARPSEVMALESRHLQLEEGVAVMESKTTRRTGNMRIIYLNGDAPAVLARLAAVHTEGPLLRNRRGEPWNRNVIGNRFRRLRAILKGGKETTAKGFRHGFATDGLEKGIPIATMAELMGHKGTKMLERHYSKLRERKQHLRDAAAIVRPKEGESSGE